MIDHKFLDELEELKPVFGEGITCTRCGGTIPPERCCGILDVTGSISVSREDVERFRYEKEERVAEIKALRAENRDLRQSLDDLRALLERRNDDVKVLRTDLAIRSGAERRLISAVEKAISSLRSGL